MKIVHYPVFFGIAGDGDSRKWIISGERWMRMAFVQWITMVGDNNRVGVERYLASMSSLKFAGFSLFSYPLVC